MKPLISTDVNDFPIFGVMDESAYAALENQLLDELKRCSPTIGVEWSNVRYSEHRLRHVIDMVERRRIYFHIFHGGMSMGELNEGCLLSFWILKLYPFFDTETPDVNVNRLFALRLFTNTILYIAEQRGQGTNINEDVVNHLIHAFTYRDLSKEAIMAIGESLIVSPTAKQIRDDRQTP